MELRGLIGSVFSGAKLGVLVIVFGGTAIFAQAMLGAATQYYMVNWLWALWGVAGLLTGLRSGYLAGQQGWLVGSVAGLLLGGMLGMTQYILTGWLAYSWQIVAVSLLSGFVGGAVGINLRLNRNYKLGRRRMFYRGY